MSKTRDILTSRAALVEGSPRGRMASVAVASWDYEEALTAVLAAGLAKEARS